METCDHLYDSVQPPLYQELPDGPPSYEPGDSEGPASPSSSGSPESMVLSGRGSPESPFPGKERAPSAGDDGPRGSLRLSPTGLGPPLFSPTSPTGLFSPTDPAGFCLSRGHLSRQVPPGGNNNPGEEDNSQADPLLDIFLFVKVSDAAPALRAAPGCARGAF
ncbi:hypothetical protein NDU88_001980 [Pleurodeles waltl]|uniref:Uncharacterized protein n=1 Tax=Pleurodeles waltl TaxID=8319 RepID=A0AAV7RED1_PLEWA|nr:hypothetical protein NDU88_001980 [Pleurodeles waltl]